jgi:hypothetical protein
MSRRSFPLFLVIFQLSACGGASKPAPDLAAASTAIAVATGSASAPATAPPAPSDPRIAKAQKRMSRVRALASKKEVPGVVLTREAMLAKVRAHVATEIPKEAIVREGQDLILADLVPEQTDYLATTFALLEEELAGFYSPEDGTMYVADDLKGELASATLNHEIVHALQDQHFGLKDRMKYGEGASDHAEATSALAEGDATSAMFDAMFTERGMLATDVPDEQTISMMSSSLGATGKTDIPPLLRVGLVAPYLHGLLFVNGLRRAAGEGKDPKAGWAAVDAAWSNPPATTEQILHVSKYLAHEPALNVPAPTFAALGPAAKRVAGDQIGELGLGLLAQGWLGAPSPSAPLDDSTRTKARQLFVGWGGGASSFLEIPSSTPNGKPAVATAYDVAFDADRPKGAAEAFTALAPALARRGTAAGKGSNSFRCVERTTKGPLAIGHANGHFYLLAGPAVPGASWTSAGDCALAKRWFDELAGATPKPAKR